MKMCPIAHQKVFGWLEFSVNIPWNWWQNCQLTSLSRSLRECTVAVCMSEVSGQYAGCAIHSCQTCLMLERAHMQITLNCSQWMPTLRLCSQVCELWTADRLAFCTWQSLLHTTALPISGLHLQMVHLLIQFTAKSVLSLRNEHCPNKQFHSTHTFSNTPFQLNLKVTALVQTPVHSHTLAEKHELKL
jgi:hypothetical protein